MFQAQALASHGSVHRHQDSRTHTDTLLRTLAEHQQQLIDALASSDRAFAVAAIAEMRGALRDLESGRRHHGEAPASALSEARRALDALQNSVTARRV